MITRPRETPRRFNRRNLLRSGAATLTGVCLADMLASHRAEAAPAPNRAFEIAKIERVTVRNPFREVPDRNMSREIPHWKWSEICSVTLKSGHTGHGETLLYYTWEATEDDDVARAHGKNAVELMWDDDLGAGLQMALFDAVGKATGAPAYALLGTRIHDRTPLAWWNIDTSPEDMATECAEAYRQGYRAYKTKGRPWFDPWAMAEATAKAVPKDFKVALDFNDTLLNAEQGIPILKELAAFPQMAIWETPIFQHDIRGNQVIRNATRVPVAMHYGRPDPYIVLTEDACDGFVIGGGAKLLLQRATGAALADKPFWLQLVGMGLTATWSKHFGAVLSHATWPAVNCHQLYEHQLITEPVTVTDGYSSIPDGPGLGCEVDWDTVEKLKVPKPKRRPEPPRVIETTWPDGRRMYLANNGKINFMLSLARRGGMPYFERGVFTKLLPNDGSARWKDLYNRGRKGPVFEE
jgi:L-alanine-DL-glutamate epimerase-like enolase superfamily enzyme